MAPKPEPKLARFVFVRGMAVTILAILMWRSRDFAAPIPPTESTPGSTFDFVLKAATWAAGSPKSLWGVHYV